MKEIVYSLDRLDDAVHLVQSEIADCDVVTFTGSLGAGKTTLIRALGKALGITQEITSPTFAYVHVYTGCNNERYVHFDLYRLHTVDEFISMGLDEYFADAQVFVEWPDVLEPLLKGLRVCRIAIDYEGLDKRILRLEKGKA
jgi:tRNA threonylcarbamoyladenosine biosynthesis protein TsaE